MVQNHLDEIRAAYESGDINRTRALIQDALREKPSPQLYRLAAELAHTERQRAYYLEKARELDAEGSRSIKDPTNPEITTARTCPYCGALNPGRNVYCGSCKKPLSVNGNPLEIPPAPPRDRSRSKTWIVFGIIILILCLWAAGLVYAGMVIFRGDVAVTNQRNLTATALALLISTPTGKVSATSTTTTVIPTGTIVPTEPPRATLVPTQTATPLIELPDLEAGRVTTEDYNFYNPAISPGHQAIAAAIELGDNWQIVEIDPISGRITREITDRDHVYTNPHYSNDGNTLLLRGDITGYYNIYLLDARTGDLIQTLTDYTEAVGYPRWMPDNHSFLYKRYSNQDAEVFIGYLDGSSPTQLTDNDRYDGSPASSPDGRTIAMSSFIDGNYEIVVLDRETGEFRQLTFHSGRDSEPVFSPDGAWIAFESDRGGDYNIWAVRPDGTGLKQMTFDGRNELIPAFSPDGDWLYFQQKQDNGNFSINRVPWP